jgi:hypothetical protein
MSKANETITFVKLTEGDVPRITALVAETFEKAVLDTLGPEKAKAQGEMFGDDALLHEAFAEGVDAYIIVVDCKESGIAVVKGNLAEQSYSLELFSISTQHHSQGIGVRVWNELEKLYPDAKMWETTTPTFAIKNVNFYVNKCKFHIVALLDMAKIAQETGEDHPFANDEDFRYNFLFQKKMRD